MSMLRLLVVFVASLSSVLRAQQTAPPPPSTPATKMEAFKPAVGSVVTVGYDEIGRVAGVSIDARQITMTGTGAAVIRGVVVQVYESQYREERSSVDEDELGELIAGIDALIAVKDNPTPFKQFEVRYETKGELQLTAFNDAQGVIKFAVRAGRVTRAQRFLSLSDMNTFRRLIVTAHEKLKSTPR